MALSAWPYTTHVYVLACSVKIFLIIQRPSAVLIRFIPGYPNHHALKPSFSSFRFAHTNPLHQDIFPSVACYEAEVVAMTAALLGSKDKNSGGQICGNMTSGGTESILLAVKSSRDYMKMKKGITKPEIICLQIVGSAPGFPHGVIDPIEELGELASNFLICFHVDLCLGGFVLPFARKLG
ncbi:hypothetical protein Taro_048104 [Colocasia esculenta]|uniref:Uncharacterized protein n=1 Tax=Colocasia esculenta TaxID=4460 RepID=A0A843X288_COLES|nr:hypothetical protein [Colocasia esculenta]